MNTHSDIEQEIEELEREAADMLTSEETRYVNHVRVVLLRNGFRIQPSTHDARILHIVHMETQQIIYALTANELRFARYGAQGWLDTANYCKAKFLPVQFKFLQSNSTPA